MNQAHTAAAFSQACPSAVVRAGRREQTGWGND